MTTKMKAVELGKPEDRDHKRVELMGKITDSLTDDALKIAMDLGLEELAKEGGHDVLIKTIEDYVMQFKADEARDLFHAGTRGVGQLSRQTGEPMTSYITRRRRWIQRLQSLDSNTKVSENILADCLLDCSGLSQEQKLMIKTVCGNRRARRDRTGTTPTAPSSTR